MKQKGPIVMPENTLIVSFMTYVKISEARMLVAIMENMTVNDK